MDKNAPYFIKLSYIKLRFLLVCLSRYRQAEVSRQHILRHRSGYRTAMSGKLQNCCDSYIRIFIRSESYKQGVRTVACNLCSTCFSSYLRKTNKKAVRGTVRRQSYLMHALPD